MRWARPEFIDIIFLSMSILRDIQHLVSHVCFYIFFTNIPNINICDRMYNDITMYFDTHEVIVHSFKSWNFMHLNEKIVNESYIHVHIKWWSLEMRAYVYKTWLFTLYLRNELSFKTFWSWIRSLEASRLYISDILI